MMNNIPEKPNNVMFTDEQWQAIYADDKDILVSASAGSGKTRVLVERVLEKIKNGVNVDELLVVTFTRAAAKEMKERIESSLHVAINDKRQQDKPHLIEQLSLLPRANISTIHAFCLEVIQRFYYVIDADPVFRLVTDTTEISLMKDSVWESLTEELLGKNEAYFELTKMFSQKFDDNQLKEMIFSLYNSAISKPNTFEWLHNLNSLYDLDENSFYESVLYRNYLLPHTKDVIIDVMADYEEVLSGIEMNPNANKMPEAITEELEDLKRIYQSLDDYSYDDIRQAVTNFSFKRWGVKKGLDDSEKAELNEFKDIRNSAKKHFQSLNDDYLFPLEVEIEHSHAMSGIVKLIAETTEAFIKAYNAHKQSRQILDFSDLEHRAYEILTTTVNDQFEAQVFYQDYFEEIMIDEYQDTNPLQEAILSTISRQDTDESNNRFMVGDVKQSIYRFRQADPGLFIDKFNRYESSTYGDRIILQENFRSRKEVIDFTNLVFQQLMDDSIGEVNYDKQAELINGFDQFPKNNHSQPELIIYEGKSELEEGTNPDSLPYNLQFTRESFIGQAVALALRLKEMVESKTLIYDKDEKAERPVTYKDIVILMRTKKNNLKLQQAFQALNVPISLDSTQNYFQTIEVSIMMSVLQLIDNPHQDLPLAAVLRSPIIGLNEEEMARVRIADRSGDYFDALQAFIRNEASKQSRTFEKLSHFIPGGNFDLWRKMSKRIPISELVWEIFTDTGFLDYVGGMPNGKQRKANLHALYERATAFEETDYKGIFQFTRYIERMMEDNHDLEEPASLSDNENAVRVMTIHGSKGLEFPVVCLLNLSSNFMTKDVQGDFTFDDNFGVGLRYINTEENYKTSTIQENAVKYAKDIKNKSEELRILYVALTRAEQKLILVGAYDSEDKAYDAWATTSATKSLVLPDAKRLAGKSYLDWIGMAIYRHPNVKVNDREVGYNKLISEHPSQFNLQFVDATQLYSAVLPELADENVTDWYKTFKDGKFEVDISTADEIPINAALDLINLDYYYEVETHTTSFQSVSEIKRIFDDPNQENLVRLDSKNPRGRNRYVVDEFERPRFIEAEEKPNPATIGSAAHALLQNIDLSTQPTFETVAETLNKLVASRAIEKNVAEEINIASITNFFQSDLGSDILAHDDSIVREVSFSLKYPAKKIFTGIQSDDDILIHGVIDGYYITDQGVVLFDYKTDEISHLGDNYEEVILDRYRGQVNLYAIALETILDQPIIGKYLVMLSNQETLEVE